MYSLQSYGQSSPFLEVVPIAELSSFELSSLEAAAGGKRTANAHLTSPNPQTSSVIASVLPNGATFVARVNPLDNADTDAATGGYLVDLPGLSVPFVPKRFDCKTADCNSYSLSGDLGDGGYFHLSVDRITGTSGNILVGNRRYVITGQTRRLSTVSETLDVAANSTPIGCGLDHGEGSTNSEDPRSYDTQNKSTRGNKSSMTGSCDLKVLYVLDDTSVDEIVTRNAYPQSVPEFIDGVHDWNQETVAESGLGGTKTLSYSVLEREYSGIRNLCLTTAKADDGLRDIRNNSQANADRVAYDADVLVYYKWDIDGCSGKAYDFDAAYDDAFIWNSTNEEASEFTVQTHELGHLLGGRHHRADSLVSFSYGQYYTAVMPNRESARMLPRYSNPNINYSSGFRGISSQPTGTTSNDNAVHIADQYCTTASYRLPGGTSIQITSQFTGNCNDPFLINANLLIGSTQGNDAGPYSYQYSWSTSPNGSRTNVSTAQSQWPFFKPSSASTYYLHLVATNSNGFQLTDQIVLTFCGGGGYYIEEPDPEEVEAKLGARSNQHSITSSYQSGSVIARLNVEADATLFGAITWHMIDRTGKEVVVTKSPNSVQRSMLDATDVPAGLYFLSARDSKGALLSTCSVIISN